MIVEFEKVREKEWNAAVIGNGVNGTIFQSTHWGEYLERVFRDRPIYVASLDKKGNILGQLLAIESSYAKYTMLTSLGTRGLVLGKLYKHVASKALGKLLPFIYWEHGPIISPHSCSEKTFEKEEIFNGILERIVGIAKERKCYEIKLARSAFAEGHNELFSSLGFWKRRMGTIIANIDEPLDVIWSRIDPTARKNIKKLKERVEIVEVSQRSQLEEFYRMHVETGERAAQKTYPFSYFASMWDHFSRYHMISVFIAKLKNIPLAGSLSLIFNGTSYDFAVADSNYQRSMKIRASDVLKWHIMEWGHERGLRQHNFAGVELYKIDAGDEKARGIYRFKSKFGGRLVEFGDYGKILPYRRKTVEFLNRYLSDSGVAF